MPPAGSLAVHKLPVKHQKTYQKNKFVNISKDGHFPPMKYSSKHSNIVGVIVKSFAPCRNGPGVGRLLLILNQ